MASVEFEYEVAEEGHTRRGDVVEISAAGLSFVLDSDAALEVGVLLVGVRIDVLSCLFDGDLRVRGSNALDGSRVVHGCLFYPATDEDTGKWVALIAGARATRGD
jgi:hypothetical protein